MSSAPSDTSQPKFVQPEIHFVKKLVALGGPDSDEKVMVSQLVRKGAILADFPNYLRMKKKGYLRSPIEAGQHVVFSEESHSLIADATGYPKATYIEQNDTPDLLVISITPAVKISHDRMQASIVIHPAIPNITSLKTEDINEIIQESGVVKGIDEKALARVHKSIHSEYVDFDTIAFAKGHFPGEGEDARLEFELEIGPLAGHVMADGTIDFRDRKIMVGVTEGQHIATKIPAVPGEEGYNVLGETIESKTGKDITVRVQGEAAFDPQDNKVVVTNDGALSVVNNNVIKVASRVKIQSDVDYTTGNIESENNTTISGSVLSGFSVTVGGDLEIAGAVSSATVKAEGNVVIKGGITGTSTSISAAGDVDISFIERAKISADGIVVIRKQSYYSTIEAGKDIRCHKDSATLAGKLIAGGSLTLGNVGAENCDHAFLAAGVDPERYTLFLQLQKELTQQQEEIIQTLQLLGRGGRPKKIRKMEEAAGETKMKLLKLNLIPGTELYSRIGLGKEREDLEEEDPLYLRGVDIENIRIEIHGKMFAGTKIMVGNRMVTLTQDIEKRAYRLSKNLKRIMAVPL